ncbi:MAG: hypothetical protein ACLQMU_01355 [Methanoregula sp.]|uniref:hypothetical protein n=1 Tax=Methanoregula sp. TaxID=2052170 RepID=UPI003C48FCC6
MTLEIDRGVVIFLDVLGVSKYTEAAQFLDFLCEMKKMRIRAQYVWDKWKDKFEQEGVTLPEPKIAIFQDSIVICFSDKVEKDNTLQNFFAAQNWLMAVYVVAIEKGLFFRGALSIGEYIYNEFDGGIAVLGLPVVDAFKHERKGNWIGVIQTDLFQKQYMNALNNYATVNRMKLDDVIKGRNPFYVKYDVPIKKENDDYGTAEYYVVNWPTIWKGIGMDKLRKMLTDAQDAADENDKKKYENTLKFVKYCEDHQFFLQ